jgi:hypothetical protein
MADPRQLFQGIGGLMNDIRSPIRRRGDGSIIPNDPVQAVEQENAAWDARFGRGNNNPAIRASRGMDAKNQWAMRGVDPAINPMQGDDLATFQKLMGGGMADNAIGAFGGPAIKPGQGYDAPIGPALPPPTGMAAANVGRNQPVDRSLLDPAKVASATGPAVAAAPKTGPTPGGGLEQFFANPNWGAGENSPGLVESMDRQALGGLNIPNIWGALDTGAMDMGNAIRAFLGMAPNQQSTMTGMMGDALSAVNNAVNTWWAPQPPRLPSMKAQQVPPVR